MKYSSWKTIVK